MLLAVYEWRMAVHGRHQPQDGTHAVDLMIIEMEKNIERILQIIYQHICCCFIIIIGPDVPP